MLLPASQWNANDRIQFRTSDSPGTAGGGRMMAQFLAATDLLPH
jgi:hypothetical protein